ncbi:MAG: SMI1/KNR4 family protein [Eubacteriales bacterium]
MAEAGFEWNTPATNEDIQVFEKENKIILPDGYKEFLLISNGALLFKDNEYGQWGCKEMVVFGQYNTQKPFPLTRGLQEIDKLTTKLLVDSIA